MRASDIRERLETLEANERDLQMTLEQVALGYAATVIKKELQNVRNELSRISDIQYQVKPSIINISTPQTIELQVGEQGKIPVTGYLSDGTMKDVSHLYEYTVAFADFNRAFDNEGFITKAVVSNDVFTEDTEIILKKTTGGWVAIDHNHTQGLQVASLEEHHFALLNFKGEGVGLEFYTDGNEAVGDNWTLKVFVQKTGTFYDVPEDAVIEVDEYGNVTAIEEGITTVRVTNGFEHEAFVDLVVLTEELSY